MLRRLTLPLCFVLFALPVLLFMSVAVPTGEVPDEVAHAIRMDGLLHGAIVGHRVPFADPAKAGAPFDSGVTANTALLTAGFSFTPGLPLAQRVMTRERLQSLQGTVWAEQAGFVSIRNTGVYAPLFYVPGAVAMGVAQVLHSGPWQAILVARVVNALLYVVIGVSALLLARRAQGLMFAALVLPMSLSLAASCNQDGLVIASATLAAALLTRGTMRGWWTGAAVLAVVVMAKPLYLPLVGMVALLLPVSQSRRGLALPLRLGGAVLAAVPALLWFGVAQAYAVVPFVRGEPFLGGPYWFGDPNQVFGSLDPGLQLQVLLHRPSLFVTLPFATMATDYWMLQGIIGILGVLDILLPVWMYGLWVTAIGLMCVGEGLAARREARPGVAVSLLAMGCVVAAVFALFDGQYLSWTYTGKATVEGMQGRYFIPLIPFLGIALPFVPVAVAGPLRAALRVPAVAAAAAGLAVIPALVVRIYYLR